MVKHFPAKLDSNSSGLAINPGQATESKSLAASKPGVKAENTPPIVSIGASAGGLEALEQFFIQVPAVSGTAFVVIQHLDPTHQGILPELLQRVTPMKVDQVRDRVMVKPNCVYVIPSNKDLSILHGKLHLLDPVEPRGLRLPIDSFFRALAADQHERAIGVILSYCLAAPNRSADLTNYFRWSTTNRDFTSVSERLSR